jgi:hypothetical protein
MQQRGGYLLTWNVGVLGVNRFSLYFTYLES